MTVSGRWIAVFLVGFGALMSVSPPVAAQQTAAKPKVTKDTQKKTAAKEAPEDERDYYTLRAKKMLEQDKATADSKPHPLTKNYPEHFVTVCEGGCKNHQAQIVDFEPRKQAKAREVGELIPTASGSGTDAASNVIECLGGCPNGNHVFAGVEDFTAVDESWDGASDASNNKSESGRWLTDRD